ncbi:MAG: nitric oxide synthase oxygenase [Cephaloticoccus sp.]
MSSACPFHPSAPQAVPPAPAIGAESEWEFLQEIHRGSGLEKRRDELAAACRAGLPAPLTAEELQWAGRIAWRNHARCIGRLHWRSLIVRDRRSVDTPEAMADCLRQHLALAQEGGLARPHLTVFAPAGPDARGPRIWNRQLCGYAGYVARDGTVLGDPANRAITARALNCGWVPPSTRSAFDLLPWLIAGPDGQVRLFPVPAGLVMEVPLRHPRYPWFERLGLRWYAVPIVCDLRLHAAATDYPAAPFNGWYMGTEVGARNLGDAGRYNQLPRVAEHLGLDCGVKRSLWQDHALLVLNEAVLHSYAAEGVKLVDHHTASDEFMRFCANESKRGRAVSARWDWIVPPISGSATKVFHQPMSEIAATPDFRIQPDPSN